MSYESFTWRGRLFKVVPESITNGYPRWGCDDVAENVIITVCEEITGDENHDPEYEARLFHTCRQVNIEAYGITPTESLDRLRESFTRALDAMKALEAVL